MSTVSALYAGTVFHERLRPKRHRLSYRVFSLLLDLDELPALSARLRLFGHNRRAPLTFRDGDHGDGGDLREWVEAHVRACDIDPQGCSIRVLCYPRVFGFVFNPLSVFFVHDREGKLTTVLYEVSNTHGERHTYVIPAGKASGTTLSQSCHKAFFVSPFVAMDCTYRFRLLLPGEKAIVSIVESDGDGVLLSAVFAGHRRPLDDRTLAWALIAYPLMTLKVIAGIHVEAVRLWAKGVPVLPWRRAARPVLSSIAGPETRRGDDG